MPPVRNDIIQVVMIALNFWSLRLTIVRPLHFSLRRRSHVTSQGNVRIQPFQLAPIALAFRSSFSVWRSLRFVRRQPEHIPCAASMR